MAPFVEPRCEHRLTGQDRGDKVGAFISRMVNREAPRFSLSPSLREGRGEGQQQT